jgi:translation initiation factor 2 beta subunit (eIF-2beta)/eIF-5
MAQYIPKDALVAEIEKRLDELYDLLPDASKVESGSITMSEACNTGKYTVLESFRKFLDTLEVKEVDLDDYYHKFLEKEWFGNNRVRTVSEMMAFTAKHFFELGLKAQKGEKV